MTETETPAPGFARANGQLYMLGPKGELIPPSAIKDQERLADDTVRDLFAKAEVQAAALKVFKERIFADVDAYCVLLFQQYRVSAGGPKGNMTVYSFDKSLKVVVQVSPRMVFGPEIHAAKALIDELLAEWTVNSRPELQALITNAFRTDHAGQMNRYAILGLRQLKIIDPRWLEAMQAISDSEKVIGSSRYIRFYRRVPGTEAFKLLSLDMATA